MDKLAKRAAGGVVAFGVITASTLSYGLFRTTQAMETRVRMGKSVPAFEAAIRLPEAPITAPIAGEEPAEKAETTAPAAPAKADLASAFGAALGIDAAKHAARGARADAPPSTPPAASPAGLELGFTTPTREMKLGDREAKSVDIRQAGGSERQRSSEKNEGERISFEVDLAQP